MAKIKIKTSLKRDLAYMLTKIFDYSENIILISLQGIGLYFLLKIILFSRFWKKLQLKVVLALETSDI